MDLYELSFLKIIKLDDDLIEVITNEGVEINHQLMEEYHNWIRTNLKHPCYILVNKLNAYTYTFDVQRNLSTIPEVGAIALLVYSKASQMATQALQKCPKTKAWNSKIFLNRQEAMNWLQDQRQRDAMPARTSSPA